MNSVPFRSGFVALVGRPNVGKSSLVNAVLNQDLAIVADKPQSTRKRFLGIWTTPDSQIIFMDSPGHHDSAREINRFMQSEIRKVLRDADWICLVCEWNEDWNAALLWLKEQVSASEWKRVSLVLTKMDLATEAELKHQEVSMQNLCPVPYHGVSAINERRGVEGWLKFLQDHLPEHPAYFDPEDLTNEPVREIVAEKIREVALIKLHQEIPYSLAVVIKKYSETPKTDHIEAELIVEKDSQKGMVIGSGGTMIREIGIIARQRIQAWLERPVVLKLQVKVDKNWTRHPEKLKKYGYSFSPRQERR